MITRHLSRCWDLRVLLGRYCNGTVLVELRQCSRSGVAYIYYDPDVLPDAVKKVLPIQEPKGHGMSVDEYEKWRAQQSGYPDALYQKKNVEERVQVTESSEDLAPGTSAHG